MYKIFINNKPVTILNKPTKNSIEKDGLLLNTNNLEELDVSIEAIENQVDLCGMHIITENPKEKWDYILSKFTTIEAAGGLIKKENKFLFIYRNGNWDLPKGKIENSETPDDAAIREVREECGLSNLKIVKSLVPTYHTYMEKGQKIVKKTHWFEMNHIGDEKPIPQQEEGITKAEWLKYDNTIKSNTFNSIRELLEAEA